MAATDYVQESFAQAAFTAVNTSLGNLRTDLEALGTIEHTVADFASLLTYDAGLAATKKLNIGDNIFVTDASGDNDVTSGWAVYRANVATPAADGDFILLTSQENQTASGGPAASTVDLAAIITN